MPNFSVVLLRVLAAVALFALSSNVQPAFAQRSAPGFAQRSAQNNPLNVAAEKSGVLARYYAPYALQADAAYLSVAGFDALPRDGSDIDRALGAYTLSQADEPLYRRAKGLLQPWQYQFGREGYIDCYDRNENLGTNCENALGDDRWTFGVSGGPAFHVWARTKGAACSEVSIAFRGTTGSVADWASNFDVVTRFVVDDEYRQLRRNIDWITKKITTLDCYRRATQARRTPQIVSVGHSLGGGLAQFAALANKQTGPRRIAKVFAFNTSPVTGAGLVDGLTWQGNIKELEIDRVHQAGEVLERVRARYQQAPTSPSSCRPLIRAVVFDARSPSGEPSSAFDLHGMALLARHMVQLSYEGNKARSYKLPPNNGGGCGTRYIAPEPDEILPPDPDPELVVASSAPGASVVRAARDNRSSARNAFAADRDSSAATVVLSDSPVVARHQVY